jgi:hypothetical protein
MAQPRPITTLYSKDSNRRVSFGTSQRTGRATSVVAAIQAGFRRVSQKDFNRCDIYNRYGAHIWSVIRFPNIGIAVIPANVPFSMYTDDDKPMKHHRVASKQSAYEAGHSLFSLPRSTPH